MRTLTKGNVFLILAAIVWGMGLVSQQTGMDHLGPLSFTAVRCALGGVSMIPLLWIFKDDDTDNKETIKASFVCALILASMILLQQYGLLFTSVGKAGFITALYILMTPVSGVLFLNKPAAKKTWIAVAVALVGMYFLCLTDGIDGINIGDAIMIGAAVVATMHIHVVDHYVAKVNPVRMCCFQFIFVGLICIIPALFFERNVLTIENIKLSAVPILYAGIASCAMGYTFQTIGQKYTEPNTASLLLSMETVFALMAGWLILGEVLKSQEYIGCILMFIAIILAQIPEKKKGLR